MNLFPIIYFYTCFYFLCLHVGTVSGDKLIKNVSKNTQYINIFLNLTSCHLSTIFTSYFTRYIKKGQRRSFLTLLAQQKYATIYIYHSPSRIPSDLTQICKEILLGCSQQSQVQTLYLAHAHVLLKPFHK